MEAIALLEGVPAMAGCYAGDDQEQGSFCEGGAEVDDGVRVEELEQMGRARADGETDAVDRRSVEEGVAFQDFCTLV